MKFLKISYAILRGFLAGIGLFFVLTIGGLIIAAIVSGDDVDLDGQVVLTHEFEGASPDYHGDDLQSLLNDQLAVMQIVTTLDAAAADPRVKGFVATIHDGQFGFAQIQELQDAIARFRAAGKFARVWSPGFGELGGGTASYWLATSFETVDVQPVGMVGLTSLGGTMLYFKQPMDELGVKMDVTKRGPYKSFMEPFSREAMSEPAEANFRDLLASLDAQVVSSIATARNLPEDQVRTSMANGPWMAEEAKDKGLIDGVIHYDEITTAIEASLGSDTNFVSLTDYRSKLPPQLPTTTASNIALIPLSGGIVKSSNGGSPSGQIVGPFVAQTIRDAIANEDIDAILIRVDSGGGSVAGSETIRRAVQQAVAANKPVVISFGNAAASGGYFMSVDASAIIAQPGTITGSIGVIAGRPDVSGLLEKLGVGSSSVTLGDSAAFMDITKPITEAQKERMETLIGAMYAGFRQRVLDGRKQIKPEDFEALAQGRVFTGKQALDLGLVDKLGGMHAAKAELRSLLGLPADAQLTFTRMPEPEAFVSLLRGEAAGAEATHRSLKAITPLLREATRLSTMGQSGAIMPRIEVQ